MHLLISGLIALAATASTTLAAPAGGIVLLPLQTAAGQGIALLPLPIIPDQDAVPAAAAAAASLPQLVNPALVPEFGVVRNVQANAKQVGSCDGFNGANVVLIPCFCPPDRDAFLATFGAAVAAGSFVGEPIAFNDDIADQSVETNKARATALIVVLQSFNGTKGVGCPAASAPNFLSQQRTGQSVDATSVA